MAINGIYGTNSYSTKMRLSGLGGSGLDTDSIVSQLMKVERIPLDRLTQKRQLTEWKQNSYREITTMLKGFQSDFFDVLKPTTNMRSLSTYAKYTSASSDASVVTAVGGADATRLSHKIVVNEIAEASNATSTLQSGEILTKELIGTDLSGKNININSYNNSFTLNFNGVSKVITLANGTYTGAAGIIGNGTNDGLLLQKVKEAFSDVSVEVDASGGIKFKSSNPADLMTIAPKNASDNLLSVLKVNSTDDTSLTYPINIEQGRKFTIAVTEGTTVTTKEIEWASDKTYNDSTTLATDIQAMIDTALGTTGKVTVDGSGDKLTFTKGAGVDSIGLSDSVNNNKVLENLGFESGDSNKLALSDTMAKVSEQLGFGPLNFTNVDGKNVFTLKINDKSIDVYDTDTFGSFMSKVNNSDAGVNLSYSSFSNTFSIISKQTGEGIIKLDSNGSNFFEATKLTDVKSGKNASFSLDGISANRASNTFTIDGVTYSLLKKDAGVEKTITLTQDPDTVFNTIKSFVDKYNEIIAKINTKLTDKYDRNYQPLTQEQKDAMNEDDIKKWEEKAKTGLLRNDSILNGIVSNMRKALSDSISGVSGGLSSIGITTGTYDERGKLIIDETKLKNAIKSSPDKVMSIFAKESTISYSSSLSSSERASRYNDNGIVNRLYDILQDNIRTTRDNNNKKGALLEKAGMIGDISEFTSILYNEMDDYNSRINDLSDRLYDKENRYYEKYSALESALSKMSSQSSWISSQLG